VLVHLHQPGALRRVALPRPEGEPLEVRHQEAEARSGGRPS
jgi:hypothetical protein